MATEGCARFLKYSVFLINLIVFLAGVGLFGIGIWSLAGKGEMMLAVGSVINSYVIASGVLLGAGSAVIIISFLGCCGAFKESKCMLLTFFILLLLISGVIITGVALGFHFQSEIKETFEKSILESLNKTKGDNSDNKLILEAWDSIQKEMKCCGANGPDDWKNVNPGVNYPESCNCITLDDKDCKNGIWKNGCALGLQLWVENRSTVFLVVGVVIALFMIIEMVFSCGLFLHL